MIFQALHLKTNKLAVNGALTYISPMSKLSDYSLLACSHFVFTAFPYEDLGTRGFTLSRELDRESHGVTTETLVVESEQGAPVALEFLLIQDETEFQQSLRQNQTGLRGREILRPSLRLLASHPRDLGRFTVGSIPVEVVAQKTLERRPPSHANSAQKIWGVYLGLKESEITEWSEFLGTPPEKDSWVLADGTRLVCGRPGDGLFEFMDQRKDFPFWAVILKCQSFASFKERAEPERVLSWDGQEAALIKEHLTDWDLLVVS